MVTNITSLTQNGLRDWLIQRVSAVILAFYTIFVFVCLLAYHPSYMMWHQLFSYFLVKIFTLIALLSLILHAWIGMWTILTDYVKPHTIRIFLQVMIFITLIAYFAWGISILWGN